MTINLADNDPRISYTVNAGVTQTTFTVPFEFFDLDDLKVYVDGTLKTKTSHYTLASGGSGATGSITMSVTGATGNSTVVITRSIALERTTDFQTSGPFAVASLNTELDKIVAIQADLKDDIDRSLRLTDFDADASLSLPDVNTRKGKTLAFNASSGAVEAGPSISDVQTVSAAAADIAALADIEDGTTATDAISGLAAIKANVTSVAGIASNVTTVAGNTSNINAVAGDATDIGTVAGISSNVTTVAGISSDVTTVAGKATEVGRLGTADAVSDMNTLGTSSNVTNMNTLAGIASDITTTAGIASSISASGTNASNAASSATAAASSATAAASSATAAAASQTAAAASASSAASSFDSFDDRYLGPKSSNPSQDNDGNALVSGALYFNSTANEMRVYDGANWIAATSAGNVSLILYEYTATAGQTTFSGSDDNSATLSYTVDNLQVVMNGVILDPSDFTATNGTSVVLASGAALNDIVNIYAFKSFTTADMVSKTNGGTFTAPVGITTADNNPQLVITSTDADANPGPEIELFRDSASPAADDALGQIQFKGRNDAGEELVYGMIDTAIMDPTDGSEDSEMRLLVKRNSDTRAALILDSAEAVFNDAGIDADFRVESDNDANAFFVQGSDGKIGIGVAAPTSQLTIGGNTNTTAKPTVQITDTTAGASLVMRGQSPKLSFDITSGGVPKVLLDGAGIEFKDGTLDAEGNVDVKIDGSGNLLVGKTTNNAIGVGAAIRADKSFFTSDGQETLVLNRDSDLGKIIEFRDSNSVVGSIGTRSTTNLYIAFRTEANGDGAGLAGSGSSSGTIIPTDGDGQPVNNHIDLGTSTNFFDDIFATGGVTTSSDQNKKQDVASLTTAEITAAKAISKLFKTFKWKHRVAEKGDAARTHTGVIAQEVQTAMTDAGLNPTEYAFWCSNTWWEIEETYTNDDGKERTRIDTYDTAEEAPEGATQRTQLSIRYAELLAFIGAATEQRLADIETRLTALEAAE